jgi:hypothetical protein
MAKGYSLSGKEAIAIGIVAILVIGFLAIETGNLSPNFWQSSTVTQTDTYTQGEAPSEVGDTPSGAYDLNPQIVDHFVMTTTRTVGTDLTVTWYTTGSDYKYLGTGDTNIDIDKSAGGYIYAAVEGTATYYLDFDKTKSGRVVAVDYFDIDDDEVKEFVCKISLWDISKEEGVVDPVTITFYSLTYGAPSLVDQGTSTTSCGTTQVDKTVEWYTSQTTTNTGYALTKIELRWIADSGAGTTYTASSTKSRMVRLKIDVPGDGKGEIDLTTAYQTRSSDILYTYNIGSNLFDAQYVYTSENDLNKQYFNVKATIDLIDSDPVFRLELYVYYLTPAASGEFAENSVTDIWYCSDTTA